jgi:hypothetical protein|tara:strand:- start:67 stop:450 length:384 start_codon:yes stop_codon:yes gene_type:complete
MIYNGIETRIIKGNRIPLPTKCGVDYHYQDMKFQWKWKGEWKTVSFFDIDYYINKLGRGVDELVKATIRHLEINEEGLYPSWFEKRKGEFCEGAKRVKRFFDELWNKGHSIKKLCLEHKLKHIIQIG